MINVRKCAFLEETHKTLNGDCFLGTCVLVCHYKLVGGTNMTGKLDLDEQLTLLMASKPKDYITDWIRKYNQNCVDNDMKERKLKGYSGKKKAELLAFLRS